MAQRSTHGCDIPSMTLDEQSTEQMHRGLQTGEVSCRAVVEHFLARADLHNPQLNAFVHIDHEGARRQADDIDARRARGAAIGALAGLPVGLKDNICQESVPATCGSRMLMSFRPPYDAHVVQRIRQADGVILGRLNLDEFAMGSSTETSVFGPVRNPWDTARTAGGSSGGSAAAVAAGLVPLALGSDTGGSIRQPAGFCGVSGFKPTYGRVSRYGLVAYASSLDQIGPFSRDDYGCRLLLQVISGHDARDSTSLPLPPIGTEDGMASSPEGLRIGVVDEHYGDGLDPEVATATRSAIDVLRAAGATVINVSLPHTRYAIAAYYLIACSEASSNLARYDGIHYGHRAESFRDLTDLYCQSRREGFGAEVKRRIMLGTYALSAGYYEAFYLKALRVRRRIRDDFDAAFTQVDVIAGPVAPTTAFALGAKLNDPLAMYLSDIYTLSSNLAGIPAVSIPCGTNESGLPIGLQLMAAPLQEDRLLQTASQFQRLTNWHLLRPPVDQANG